MLTTVALFRYHSGATLCIGVLSVHCQRTEVHTNCIECLYVVNVWQRIDTLEKMLFDTKSTLATDSETAALNITSILNQTSEFRSPHPLSLSRKTRQYTTRSRYSSSSSTSCTQTEPLNRSLPTADSTDPIRNAASKRRKLYDSEVGTSD